MKRVLKQGTKFVLVLAVFSFIMASATAVHAGKEDIPRIVSIDPIIGVEHVIQ